MAGAWDLGTPNFFQSPSSRVQPVQKCQGLPGGSDCLGGWLWSPARREGARGDLAPGLPIRGGRQEPVSENPKQVPDTRLLFARKAEVPSESRRRVR